MKPLLMVSRNPALAVVLLYGAVAPCMVLADPAPARSADAYRWDAAGAGAQLAADKTVVPRGMGALFIPALTSPDAEPAVLVQQGNREVAVERPGRRIVLEPGTYQLLVGSGPLARRMSITAAVQAGQTTLVPVTWGGLKVETVDRKLRPHRGGYELFRLATGESVGVGFGADPVRGDRLETWLLPPGLYRLVQPGGEPGDRVQVSSVHVPRGGLVRHRVTMDRSGSILGATSVLPGEMPPATIGRPAWRPKLVLGVDGSFSHLNNTVGMPDFLMLTGSAFVNGKILYSSRMHLLRASMDIEAGAAFITTGDGKALPLLKSRDRLRLELLYSLMALPWLGPYGRAMGQASMLPSHAIYTRDETLRIRQLDGTTSTRTVQAMSRFTTSEAFAPVVVQLGGGAAVRAVNSRTVTITARAGVAARFNFFREALVSEDDPDTSELELRVLDDFNQVGLEGTVDLDLRLNRWLTLTSSVEYFGEFEALDDPLIEWHGRLTFKLTRHISVDYRIELQYWPQVTTELQFQQGASLRASFSMF